MLCASACKPAAKPLWAAQPVTPRPLLRSRDDPAIFDTWLSSSTRRSSITCSEMGALAALNDRSREIFRRIVDSYLATGDPVGSRNLSRVISMQLSPASVRNVMQDLEELGLIYAPHTSAGRMPTHLGLRFFVDALLEIGDLSIEERTSIEMQVKEAARGRTSTVSSRRRTSLLSGLCRGAAVVVTSKENIRLKHIEFVRLDPERAMAILVAEDGFGGETASSRRHPGSRCRPSPRQATT